MYTGRHRGRDPHNPPRGGQYPRPPRGGGGGGGRPGKPNLPGPVTTPGYTPDYEALIGADAGLVGWRAQANNQLSHAGLSRAEQVRQMALRYGGLPSGAFDAYGDLGSGDIDAGARNMFSDSAMIRKGYDQNLLNVRRSLAARGALQSGELGYGQDQAEEARAAEQSEVDANFLERLRGVLGDYTGVVDDLGGQEIDQINAASERVREQYKPTPAGTAQWIKGSRRKYGQWLWRDDSGQVWAKDAAGNPVKWEGTL